jgi:predicted transcriptional regulator
MNVLWDAPAAMTPRDVHTAVSSARRPLAYTTVTTILVRLWEKGMLQREQVGRGYAYRPAAAREDWAAARIRELLEASGDPRAALQQFVGSMSAKEATTLRHLLDERSNR